MKRSISLIMSMLLIMSLILTVCGTASASSYSDPTVPRIGSASYGYDVTNDTIRWVQQQLKATGIWYQGDEWKVTGHLGKHTMQEIARFMEYRGYRGHSGAVTQQVIDELYAYNNGDRSGGTDHYVPQIDSAVYELDAKNDVIRWVQEQLKATGIWYQGNEWKVTGHLGKHTMQEIARFMEYRGYRGHSGAVTQQVINELDAYLYGTGDSYDSGD